MEEKCPSWSASAAAMTRAAHLLVDDDPKILQDNFALGLSGFDDEATLRSALEAQMAEAISRTTPLIAKNMIMSYRAFAVMRHRYTEDELEKALEAGISQYVILGTGLDSFALRRPDLHQVLDIYEIDHPATQQWKRQRMQALNIAPPPNLKFLPIDFETKSLTECLKAGDYAINKPAFFSWLGVTQYLTEDAVFKNLQEISALAEGSEVVFEYTVLDSLLNEEDRQLLAIFKASAAARGEPWLNQFDPDILAEKLMDIGFASVSDFGPEEANARYFSGRTDGLRTLRMPHIIKARVGGTF
ncbi:conserved hypothetical protein [uncultured Desulfobacterium sp.]|uniref:S-adenosyl-L-methionine-dependent methyltransferase n=1 Tax=uncultured Desulfobacterium sp. TaxID=201089 RepID=A0A445N0S9_9BACT|nr:conserved hypothetical protein [uncultured Desulfobacterium sp.]